MYFMLNVFHKFIVTERNQVTLNDYRGMCKFNSFLLKDLIFTITPGSLLVPRIIYGGSLKPESGPKAFPCMRIKKIFLKKIVSSAFK